MSFLSKGAVAMAAGRALRRVLEGAGNVERDARQTADPAPHEAVDEAASVRMANRETAREILGRKQALLDAKFNGKVQTMESLLQEMREDSDLSDCPDHFDWKWCDQAGDFIKAESRKVEFK